MGLDVYGIPTCGTCKKAIAFLDAHSIPYSFINLKEHPPIVEVIRAWVTTLGARPLRNTSGQSYRALGPEKDCWDDGDWIAALGRDAMLIKRPVFVRTGKAIWVGFRGAQTELLGKLLGD